MRANWLGVAQQGSKFSTSTYMSTRRNLTFPVFYVQIDQGNFYDSEPNTLGHDEYPGYKSVCIRRVLSQLQESPFRESLKLRKKVRDKLESRGLEFQTGVLI